ncbi:MAG TPA: hypothetical protein VFR73_20395 [Hyphomicrobiaceae bacterium]|nr:hypothetical protein [Hyphomicrobiaceae bacterium]
MATSPQAAKTADASGLFDLVRDGTQALLASIRQGRQAARDRSAIAALSDAQLADAGIDRWSIEAPCASIEVEAGLMANLMSMR